MATTTSEFLKTHRVFIAVGSNLGDRYQNIASALSLLCERSLNDSSPPSARLVRTPFLYETAPMYLTDQPCFLNGAVEIETRLEPHALLERLKQIEKQIGRDLNGVRNGPRLIDLDILFYEDRAISDSPSSSILLNSSDLVIPHPRIQEREFVLAPLCDLAGY